MKKRTIDYLGRKKAFTEMHHPKDVKSLLVSEFKASKSIVVKKDILKTLEQITKMGKQNITAEPAMS